MRNLTKIKMNITKDLCTTVVTKVKSFLFLSDNAQNICECFPNNGSSTITSTCCVNSNHSGLSSCSQKIENSFKTPTRLDNTFPSALALFFLSDSSCLNAIKDVLSLMKNNKHCGINVSDIEMFEKNMVYIEHLKKPIEITLSFMDKIHTAIVMCKKLFLKILGNFTEFQIAIPLCISLSVTIYALGPFLNRCTKQKNEAQSYVEEIQYTIPRYPNRTYNNYLLWYQ
ncbi:hypothetical protein PGO_011790 [Plasmodium gonderi]|uniref:Variable surface protein n=1 Tax=Plasmodium gonderi TaxID=77519 RepID=A0A1Y1J940_PLAGO|nr:hypothetical protein PGO_011790 [Plasmodium gonderi]GAW79029.1 hypothetical protein PGO_011790 [Plasmodium gonderi]